MMGIVVFKTFYFLASSVIFSFQLFSQFIYFLLYFVWRTTLVFQLQLQGETFHFDCSLSVVFQNVLVWCSLDWWF